jgi:hypothetical protein
MIPLYTSRPNVIQGIFEILQIFQISNQYSRNALIIHHLGVKNVEHILDKDV